MSQSYQTMSSSVSLKDRVQAELELRRRRRERQSEVPEDWQDRLREMFPAYLFHGYSEPHLELGAWADDITLTNTPRPFVALWARGRGKSTWAEMTAADLGARGLRRYCLYVSETQDQADKHVATIGHMLESDDITQFYPDVGRPMLGKNGSRSWNRRIMQAANGFTVEAIGLDKAIRGQKIDWVRPDLIIFDDVDGKHDTENAVKKKQETLTTSILPAGSDNCAVLFVQNIIHDDSIAHRLSKTPGAAGAADYLANRIISGPYPAIDGLVYKFGKQDDGSLKWTITAGASLWAGFGLDSCEAEINREGPTAFELESQHNIGADNPNALLATEILNATRVTSHPDLYKVGVGVDPSGGAGQCGIIGGGVGKVGRNNHGFTIADYSTPEGTPSSDWAIAALRCYDAIGADFIAVEDNFGGDMVENTIRTAELIDGDDKIILKGKNVSIIRVHASRGKEVRAQPVASLFQLGKTHHVGFFPELEKQWTQWEPGTKPSPDRLDAEVWIYTELLVGTSEPPAGEVINDIDLSIYKSKRERSIYGNKR